MTLFANWFVGLGAAIMFLFSTPAETVKSIQSSSDAVQAVTYYQTTEGNYVKTDPGTPCLIPSSNPCTIIFEDDPELESFNISELDNIGIPYDVTADGRRQ